MAVNNKPIFTGTPQIDWCINAFTGSSTQDLTAAHLNSGSNGSFTIASGIVGFQCFTSDVTNGGYVQKIRFKAIGTAATSTTATTARVWINNGSPLNTAANNVLFDEITLPATTISLTAANPTYELPLNFALPAGYKIFVTLGTSQANTSTTGWDITVIGGSYVAQP